MNSNPNPDSSKAPVSEPAISQDGLTADSIPHSPKSELDGDALFADTVVNQPANSYRVWGDFEIHELLGEGGMGAVYKGRQISLDRVVAIKVLPADLADNPNFIRRFELEAKAIAKISSPHVVQVYAAGKHEGKHYFAMEYVEGQDLSQRLNSGYTPSLRESMEIIQQAARGLAAANELHIIHRDIKPGNMMMTKKGLIKLMDFGLVKILSGDITDITQAGTKMGTVSYFSPEQGRGELCDQRTDIYALGVVFYRLVTKRLPFIGNNPAAVIYQHNFENPIPPRSLVPDLHEEVEAVILKCMAKKVEERYFDAGELLSSLDRLLHRFRGPPTFYFNQTVNEIPPPVTVAESPLVINQATSSSIKPVLWSLLLLLLVITVVLGILLVRTQTLPLSPDQARLLLQEGKYIQCREIVEANIAISPYDQQWFNIRRQLNAEEAGYFIHLARAQFDRHHYSAARATIIRANKIIPGNSGGKELLSWLNERDSTLNRAREYLTNKNFQSARTIAEEQLLIWNYDSTWKQFIESLNAAESEYCFQKAESAYDLRRYPETKLLLARLLKLSPDHVRGTEMAAKLKQRDQVIDTSTLLLYEGNYGECRTFVTRNLHESPDDVELSNILLELNRREAQALFEMAKKEFNRQNYDEAMIQLTQALKYQPDYSPAINLSARLNERDAAISQINQDISAAKFFQARQEITAQQLRWENDLEWSRLMLAVNQAEGNSLFLDAHGKLSKFDYVGAASDLGRVIELMPNNQEAKKIIAAIANRERELRQGNEFLTEGNFSACRKLIAVNLRDWESDPEWIDLLSRLNHAEVTILLAQAREKLAIFGYSEAAILLQYALTLLPNHNEAVQLNTLIAHRKTTLEKARVALAEKQFDRCRDLLNEIFRDWPNDPEATAELMELNRREVTILLSLALQAMSEHDYDSAIKNVNKILVLSPDHPEARELFARLEQRRQALTQAREFLKANKFDESRQLIVKHLAASASDHEWRELLDQLNATEGQYFLTQTHLSLAQADLTSARQHMLRVICLIPDHPMVKNMLPNLDESTQQLIWVHQTLKSGDWELSRKIIEKNLALYPHDQDWLSVRDKIPALADPAQDPQSNDLPDAPVTSDITPSNEENVNLSIAGMIPIPLALKEIIDKLDRAMVASDRVSMLETVNDPNYASTLSSLMGQPGLIYRHQLHSYTVIDDHHAQLQVIITHGLLHVPTTNIYYQYNLEQIDDHWIIHSAQPLPIIK